MRERLLAAALAAGIALACASAALAEDSPVVASCANAALPQAILDGTFDGTPASLAVVTVRGVGEPLTLAVADDESTRELGLMCVTRLRPHAGMIFVFDDDVEQEFWMKNTLVPLDMVWVATDGRVENVASRVPASTRRTPDSRVARRRGVGRYVIELPSGEAEADGIRTGITLSLPQSLRSRAGR